MNVVHIVDFWSEKFGGVPRYLRWMNTDLKQRSFEVFVWVCREKIEPEDKFPYCKNFSIIQAFDLLFKPVNGFYMLHGLWSLKKTLISLLLSIRGIEFCYVIHGALYPDALEKNRILKKIYFYLVQRYLLRRAQFIVCSCDQEAKTVESFGIATTKIILPIGLSPEDKEAAASVYAERANHCSPNSFLYIGRIDPRKRIFAVLELFSSIDTVDIRVVGDASTRYGSDMQDHFANNENIHFVGPIYGVQRFNCFRSAEAMILLSTFENFGITILEAIASGCPVIILQSNMWAEEIKKRKAGWVVENVAELERLLNEWGSSCREIHEEKSKQARLLAEKSIEDSNKNFFELVKYLKGKK